MQQNMISSLYMYNTLLWVIKYTYIIWGISAACEMILWPCMHMWVATSSSIHIAWITTHSLPSTKRKTGLNTKINENICFFSTVVSFACTLPDFFCKHCICLKKQILSRCFTVYAKFLENGKMMACSNFIKCPFRSLETSLSIYKCMWKIYFLIF